MMTSPAPSAPPLAALPPWPGVVEPFLHPDRMSLLGALHGVPAVDLAHARVLELGAGDGASILPLAAAWPDAKWVGVEADALRALRMAETAVTLRLGNVTAIHAGLEAAESAARQLGEFDYVVAHGLLSRVGDAERGALWRLVEKVLAPHGIALVSFDAWPGQHLAEPLRRLMAFHVEALDDDAERVSQARAIARWHIRRWESVHGPMRTLIMQRLGAEVDALSDETLLRELLPREPPPSPLQHAVAEAGRHRLQWLTNARPSEPRLGRASSALRTMLGEIPDIVRQQQYLDFFFDTRFRTSLFCRHGIELKRQAHVDDFARFVIGARPGFELEGRATVEARWMLEHALADLDGLVTVSELVDRALAKGFPRDRITAQAAVVELFFADAIELARARPPLLASPPAADTHPRTTAYALAQARSGAATATSLWLREVPLIAAERAVLARCDGTRPADEIVEDVGPDGGDALDALYRYGFLYEPRLSADRS
ncbi:MAG: class I SAM-dependent methyltransferase [Myxococcota bacterium]